MLLPRHNLEVIALVRAGDAPRPQERPPQEGPAAALARHGVPGRGAAEGDAPVLVLLHHVQGDQQPLGILVPQGQHAAAAAPQPGVLHKVQLGHDVQLRAQQQEDPPGQGGVFHPVGHLDAARAAEGQAAGGLRQGGELAEDAAALAQGQADQLLLGR